MQTSDQSSEDVRHPQEHLRGPDAEMPLDAEKRASQRNAIPAEGQPGPFPAPAKEFSEADEEAILKGLLYPPPPSFYATYQKHQEQKVPEHASVGKEVRAASVVSSASSPSGGAPQPANAPSPVGPGGYPYPVPGFPPPPGPYGQKAYPYPYPHPRPRQSYAWIWVLVGLISVLLLTACGLMAWISYSIYGDAAVSVAEARRQGPLVVNKYYSALQEQDYERAFSHLKPATTSSQHDITLESFTKMAQQRDEQQGLVRLFETGEPKIDNRSSGIVTTFTLPVKLERDNGEQYTAQLTLRKVEKTWFISDFDML